MKIITRMCMSLDGYVTTPAGWPAQLADPDFSPQSYGFVDFQAGIGAVLIGRTTFEPALGAERWPWGDLGVYVLASRRPEGTPEHVVIEDDPERLHERMLADHADDDVHLVGGPTTIEAFRSIGALDRLGLLILPRLLGEGVQLTPAIATGTRLTLRLHSALPHGVVEVVYEVART